MSTNKDTRPWMVSIRLSKAEFDAWNKAADSESRTLSDWIRLTVNETLTKRGTRG